MQKYIDSWNSQADNFNSWQDLSGEEQSEWIFEQSEKENKELRKEVNYYLECLKHIRNSLHCMTIPVAEERVERAIKGEYFGRKIKQS